MLFEKGPFVSVLFFVYIHQKSIDHKFNPQFALLDPHKHCRPVPKKNLSTTQYYFITCGALEFIKLT